MTAGAASDDAVLVASREERALYDTLLAVYGVLHDHLRDAAGIDAAWVTAQRTRAAALVDALATVAHVLAPRRLTGDPVTVEVQALWRASAALATAAVELNGVVAGLARGHQTAIGGQLVHAAQSRHVLVAYRPPAPGAAGVMG